MSTPLGIYDSGASDAEIAAGIAAAKAVFERAKVSVDDCIEAVRARASGESLTSEQTARCATWDEADNAAMVACCAGWARIPEAAHLAPEGAGL